MNAPGLVMLRATELLEEDASEIKASHTLEGKWIVLDDSDARAEADYNERMALAAKLRLMAGLS